MLCGEMVSWKTMTIGKPNTDYETRKILRTRKYDMEELLQPWVSMEEFDFMLENNGKDINEIKFDEE